MTPTAPSLNIPHETRERLLDVAGEIFAEHGRAAARVRDICDRAGTNIAAINYHFGDKDSLYLECLRHARRYLLSKHPIDAARPGNGTPEQRLRAYVQTFLRRFLDAEGPQWHGKLFSREMLDPTGALDEAVEEAVRPQADLLTSIVDELAAAAGAKLDRRVSRLCGESITAQCLFYRDARSILLRLTPGRELGAAAIECLTEHITRFSLAAIRDLAQRPSAQPAAEGNAAGTTGTEPT